MIISITSLKGGVGKSTLSQNLAVCLAHIGYKVAIIDTDTNASSVHWSGLRPDNLPSVAVFGISDSEALSKNAKKLVQDYDIVLIDGTPSLSRLVSTIILLGDMVLIPIKPSALDVWATEKFIEKYDQASVIKDVKAYFILNQYDANLSFNRDSKEVLSDLNIPILKSTLKTRVAYVEAVVQGLGVYEYKDKKARDEMAALCNEIVTLFP
ncbi:MAG: AAA family ATPase [Chitinophagales bacterium]|jgi:chromosome partitioning protein|nr:AAA family ATPase [Chitinophagales bacterium]HNI43086.1 ParA family partition ATPase [Chitinophagales bacterium]HNL06020.1 ParA family partition ATPase [Chitinophagales bacterium]